MKLKQKTKVHLGLLVGAVTTGLLYFNFTPSTSACKSSPTCLEIAEVIGQVQRGEISMSAALTPLSDAEIVDHAANRFGFGLSSHIRPGELPRVRMERAIASIARDIEAPRNYIRSPMLEIASRMKFTTPNGKLEFYPLLMSPIEAHTFHARIAATRNGTNDEAVAKDMSFVRSTLRNVNAQFRLVMHAFDSETGTGDSLVDHQANFAAILHEVWFNHFNVDYAKVERDATLGPGGYEPTLYSRQRSSFNELLHAAITHPAMIRYLDNQTNVYSIKDLRASNQNLGRELLELHTLGIGPGVGPNGGFYQQSDVEASAAMLTGLNIKLGWSDATKTNYIYEVQFNPDNHVKDYVVVGGANVEVAPVIMGKKYCYWSDSTVPSNVPCPIVQNPSTDLAYKTQLMKNRLNRYLRDLASHPRTKVNICNKLVNRFAAGQYVASGKPDDPNTSVDESKVDATRPVIRDRCIAAWGEAGDLKSMYRAILTSPHVWTKENYLAMNKDPIELVISTVRAAGITSNNLRAMSDKEIGNFAMKLAQQVRFMGLPYRHWMAPTGYKNNGWLSQGYLVRWTVASFEILNLLEQINANYSAPIMGLVPGAGLEQSPEFYMAAKLESGRERHAFLHAAMGLGGTRVEPDYFRSLLEPLLENQQMANWTKQRIEGQTYPVPLKTGLSLKVSNAIFIRQ